MDDEQAGDERAGTSYRIGDVGPGAQVAQGHDIRQTMRLAGVDADEVRRAFEPVLALIDADEAMDADDKQDARDAVAEVREATLVAGSDPSRLRRSLSRARKLVGSAWDGLVQAMTSEPVQKTIGTITEAAARASIQSMLGR